MDNGNNSFFSEVINFGELRDENGKLVYSWPYSKRCPDCGEEAMVGDKCTACGIDNYQEKCPKCSKWVNNRQIKEFGHCTFCERDIIHKKSRATAIALEKIRIDTLIEDVKLLSTRDLVESLDLSLDYIDPASLVFLNELKERIKGGNIGR